jgi:hypothetical protein
VKNAFVPAITVLKTKRLMTRETQNTLKEKKAPIFFISDTKTDPPDTV